VKELRAVKVLWLEYSAMPTRQNGRISQLWGRRARSARARGLRTLQHQALARSTLAAIEAEIWLRTLIVERARADASENVLADPTWATKDQVHDEALTWYLRGLGDDAARSPKPSGPAPARRGTSRQGTHQDVTFWVDSRLLARARRRAVREGVRLAQLIERALDSYIAEHISADVVRFHRRAQAQALSLHRRRSKPE
jgi:hypothetical protein